MTLLSGGRGAVGGGGQGAARRGDCVRGCGDLSRARQEVMDSARHVIKRIPNPRVLSQTGAVGYCSPHHHTHFEPLCFQSNGD